MTFEQLRYFITAMQSKNFFEAADSLYIGQSALSKQIMKLEKELDIKLFDRSRRRAVPTPAGLAFYEEAQQLYAQYEKMMQRMYPFQECRAREVRIGTLPIISQYDLTALIYGFARQYPDIPLKLDEVEEKGLMEGLKEGQYDYAILRRNMLDPKSYEYIPLAEDRLVAVLSRQHPLAGAESLTLTELCRERLTLMKDYTSIYQLCLQLFAGQGLSPSITGTARLESILGTIAINGTVSLLPQRSFALFKNDSLKAVPLEPEVLLSVGLARKKANPASHKLRMFESWIKKQTQPIYPKALE